MHIEIGQFIMPVPRPFTRVIIRPDGHAISGIVARLTIEEAIQALMDDLQIARRDGLIYNDAKIDLWLDPEEGGEQFIARYQSTSPNLLKRLATFARYYAWRNLDEHLLRQVTGSYEADLLCVDRLRGALLVAVGALFLHKNELDALIALPREEFLALIALAFEQPSAISEADDLAA